MNSISTAVDYTCCLDNKLLIHSKILKELRMKTGIIYQQTNGLILNITTCNTETKRLIDYFYTNFKTASAITFSSSLNKSITSQWENNPSKTYHTNVYRY